MMTSLCLKLNNLLYLLKTPASSSLPYQELLVVAVYILPAGLVCIARVHCLRTINAH